jgi:hypothetical protein
MVEMSMALALEQDQAIVNFRKGTGASGEFDENIRGLERSLFGAGVTAAEAGEAVQDLYLNVTDFTIMSSGAREEVAGTVAVLNELGVSSQTTAKNIQFATKVLGQGTKQAAALQREMFAFAQDLGVSTEQMAGDFAEMGPQIAALGSNGVDAFYKLEVQAKNTGLALSEILGVVEQFDKFDTAAQSVGKLNALLGGPYLNTLELVAETDPSERFRILKERIDEAGVSFDDMDYYQRKAMASAVGLNEQQLALMMRGRLDLIQEPQKSAADLEALAEQTKNFNSVMEELTQIARMFAISFGPVVSLFKGFLQLIQDTPVIREIVGITVGLVAFAKIGMALFSALKVLSPILTVFGTVSAPAAAAGAGALNVAVPPLAKSMSKLALGIGKVGAASMSTVPFLLALTGAGVGIGAIFAGIGYMFMGIAEAIGSVAAGIELIVASINKIELDKTIQFSVAMGSVAMAGPALAAVADAGTAGRAGATVPVATPPALAPAVNVKVYIGEEDFTRAVNKVEVNGTRMTVKDLGKAVALGADR